MTSNLIQTNLSPVEKAWGTSTILLQSPQLEIVRIDVMKGGYCSDHFHSEKFNGFVVLEGVLTVVFFDQNGRESYRVEVSEDSHASPQITVPAGRRHFFRAVTPVIAIETYWPAGSTPLDPDDIIRFSEGGVAE